MNSLNPFRYFTTKMLRKITTSTQRLASQYGNSQKNFISEFKAICQPFKLQHNPDATSISTSLSNSSENKKRNISPLLIPWNDPPENKFRPVWPITILIRRAMKSITSGSVSTYARRMKKIKRQLWLSAILNWMSGTLQLISLIKKDPHTIVYSLREDAVRMVSIVATITKFHVFRIVNKLTKLKTFLVDPVSALLERIWKELAPSQKRRKQSMWATSNYPTMKTEWLKCIKFYWDIFHFGVNLKTLTSFLIKDSPL